MPSTSPPMEPNVALMINFLRETFFDGLLFSMVESIGGFGLMNCSSFMNGFANPVMGGAAANIGNVGVNFFIRRIGDIV